MPSLMWTQRYHQWLTVPQLNRRSRPYRFWWWASLLVALSYALLALNQALGHPFVVQDDARQFVFWMQRWQDPSLFPNDWIADYFERVTPWGFKGLYGVAIALGIPPFTVNLGLPLILGLISTHYLFRITMGILPVPFTAWMACVLLNQTLWMKDDLVSATPRAFVYPLFLAFWFYWSQFQQRQEYWAPTAAKDQASAKTGEMITAMGRSSTEQPSLRGVARSLSYCALSLGLLGLFYPQYVLVAGGMLVISLIGDMIPQQRSNHKWRKSAGNSVTLLRSGDRPLPFRYSNQWIFYAITLMVAAIVISFYTVTASNYGPVVTLQHARTMAEFWPGGRNFFFSDNLWWFYGVGDRSGFFHVGLVRPATLSLGIFLPVLLHWRQRFPLAKFITRQRFPLAKFITPQLHHLSHLLLSASLLFFTAHLTLFRLHLPSRYTDHSLRMILAIATALTLTLLLDRLSPSILEIPSLLEKNGETVDIQDSKFKIQNSKFKTQSSKLNRLTPLCATVLLLSLLMAYPLWVRPFPLTKYKIGRTPEIYAYLQTQPVDTVVASIAKTVDNVPVFAQRSILVGYEYAIPYHTGYYGELRRRAIALLQAQYSRDPEELIRFIQDYHVDFWLLETDAYEPDFFRKHWTQQYLSDPTLTAIPELLENLDARSRRDRPILQRWQPKCTVLTEADVHLIDAQCLVARRTP